METDSLIQESFFFPLSHNLLKYSCLILHDDCLIFHCLSDRVGTSPRNVRFVSWLADVGWPEVSVITDSAAATVWSVLSQV